MCVELTFLTQIETNQCVEFILQYLFVQFNSLTKYTFGLAVRMNVHNFGSQVYFTTQLQIIISEFLELEQQTSQEGRVIKTVNEPELSITTEVKLTPRE